MTLGGAAKGDQLQEVSDSKTMTWVEIGCLFAVGVNMTQCAIVCSFQGNPALH